jgi:acyl-CoA reductase-like NAD-dependent aldehyde dehydrogenase
MSATIVRHNPADSGEVVATYERNTPADVAAACARAADEGLGTWGRLPGPARGAVLYRAAQILSDRAEEIALGITREEGKALPDARGETLRAAAVIRFHAGEAERFGGSASDSAEPSTVAWTRRRPVGVVALITPWNFPIAIPAWKLAPALACGNAVVIKPSSQAPGAVLALAAAMIEAGVPEATLQVMIGSSEIGTALVDDERVAAVSFTGSNAVGRGLGRKLAERSVRFQAELGGNNPLIVLADADIERAARIACDGAFLAAGQKCTATRRVIAEAPVFEPLLEAITRRASGMKVGNGLDPDVQVPPLVQQSAADEVQEAIDAAASSGATIVSGGHAPGGELEAGSFILPTVLADVAPGMKVIDDEVFGPVCSVISAGGLDEAIELANAVPYGLSASICTNDLAGAFSFIERIDAGMVHVNRPTPGADPHLPFGGVKASSVSGYREQGHAAVQFFSEGQTVYLNYEAPSGAHQG